MSSRAALGGIGVFDSGVGGLTVAAALRRRLPAWPIVYLGDTARLPYGTKSAATVRRYTERNVEFLASQNVQLTVVACNSASSILPLQDASDQRLGAGFGEVLGVILPGAAQAAKVAKKRVGVVATEATVLSEAYLKTVSALRPDLEVYSVACPLLVPLVEEGWLDDDITRQVVRRYVQPLIEADVDTLILGCTHYPLLAPLFGEVMGEHVALVDSAEAVALEVETRLADCAPPVVPSVSPSGAELDASSPLLRAFVTDDSPRFERLARAILGEPLSLQWIDISL